MQPNLPAPQLPDNADSLFELDIGAVLAHVNDAIIVTDSTYRVRYWSRGAERIYGWAESEARGRNSAELIPVAQYLDGGHMADLLAVLYEQNQWAGTVAQHHRNGQIVYVESSMRLLRDAGGAPIGLVTVNRDVSERVHAEHERAAAQSRLRLLADVSDALVQVRLDLAATLDTVARQIGASLGDAVLIVLLDEHQVLPEAFWHSDPGVLELLRAALRDAPVRVADPGVGKVIETGQPILMRHVDHARLRAAMKPAYMPFFEQVGIDSLVIVPLRAQGRVIGAVQVTRDRLGRPYTADDQQLLQEIADRAALAIESGRLYRAAQQARAMSEQATRRMTLLQRITSALAEAQTLDHVFTIMLDEAMPTVGASRGGVALLNLDATVLQIGQVRGFPNGVPKRWPEVPLAEPMLLTDAVRARTPLFLRSLEEKLARYPHMANIPTARDNPVQAAFPLIVDGQVLGVFQLIFDTPQDFPGTDQIFLQSLAQQCAQAIKRAQLAEREERAHRARDEVLAQLSTLLAAAPIGICFWDSAGVCLQLNDTFAALSGQSIASQQGQPVEAMAPSVLPHLAEDLRAVLATGEPRIDREVSGALPTAAGDMRHWLMSVYAVRARGQEIIGVGAVVVEITGRKQLEAQLLQSQKMESVGRLAGGIAHDFNNLLTVIQGYTDLAQSGVDPAAPLAADLEEIQRAAKRAAELTSQLLAFARKQVMSPRVISLNRLIVTLDKLLRRLIGEHIRLHTHPAALHDAVRADPGQIEQVLINLALNARDAMPHGGTLTIETQMATLEGAQAGRFVLLAVSDTGVGMSAATREHAFEPFFTTKEVGKGTGLGLATCYGIVKQHGGHIWIYSEEGCGTTVKVYLPRADERAELPSPDAAPGVLPLGNETILVAEDEDAVRQLAARVLRAQGYTVLEAANGDEALRVALAYQPGVIDMLLTDVVMPGQVGTGVAAEVAAIYPGIKVLYTSGYTKNAFVQHGALEGGVGFVPKPFTPAVLAQAVRRVLDG